MSWLDALPKNRRRGSFPRCLLFMQGDRTIVPDKLTKLVGLPDVHVGAKDFWMPQGLPVLKANGEWDTDPIAYPSYRRCRRWVIVELTREAGILSE